MRGPWGEDYFLEGFGYGFFADALATYDPGDGKSVFRALETIVELLGDTESYQCQMRLDGQDISGNFVMVEVLNTASVGPRLKLAPKADPGDGLFEVVRLHEDDRDGFLTYCANMLLEDLEELPSVKVTRGRKLEIDWTGFTIHVDAEVRPEESKRPADKDPAEGARPRVQGASKSSVVSVEVMPQALEVWLPHPPSSKEENASQTREETSEEAGFFSRFF